MLKVCVLIIFFLFGSLSLVFGQNDFRRVKWGASKEDVLKSETNNSVLITEYIDGFLFEGSLSDLIGVVRITYKFTDNKLYEGRYDVPNSEDDGRLIYSRLEGAAILHNYDKLYDGISKKYGSPKREEKNFNVQFDLSEEQIALIRSNKYTYWLDAIRERKTWFMSEWETSKTEILLVLGTNSLKEWEFKVVYTSKKFEKEKSRNDY